MAFGNKTEQKSLITQFRKMLKTLRFLAFTKTPMAAFGLEHTKMEHLNSMGELL
jgi:hypothetical protein